MFKRKGRLLAGALCAALAALLIVPAAAHGCHSAGRGHHGGYRQAAQPVQTTVTVCPYDGCTAAGRHLHDGLYYCGYSHASGVCDNNCRALCSYEDCRLTGRHVHSGTACCGYAHTGGFCDGTCRALCPYKDCTLTGPHTHNGVGYCGDSHEAGFCYSGCHTTGHGCRA